MGKRSRYRVNSPKVIGEVLDREAIIVNLDSGAYYSVRDAGALVWQLVERAADHTTLIDAVCQVYRGNPAEISKHIDTLLEEMVQEALLLNDDFTLSPVDESTVDENAGSGKGLGDLIAEKGGDFVPPTLEKYTDMADILLLDPIHEVGEQGWPQPAPPQQ